MAHASDDATAYVIAGTIARDVRVALDRARVRTGASGVDVEFASRGGIAFALPVLSDDAVDGNANGNANGNATTGNGTRTSANADDGFVFVATYASIEGAIDARIVRECGETYARDVGVGAMDAFANATRVLVPPLASDGMFREFAYAANASRGAYVESVVFLETNGSEARARFVDVRVERGESANANASSGAMTSSGTATTTTTTTTTTINGGDAQNSSVTSEEAMAQAAEALAHALADANARSIATSADAATKKTFTLVWALLVALFACVFAFLGWLFWRYRRRARKAREKKEKDAIDAREAKTTNADGDAKSDDLRQLSPASEAQRKETRANTRMNAEVTYQRYRGTLPPLFAHMNSLSRESSGAHQTARIARIDSLGVAASALVDHEPDVALEINRTVSSEENFRIAIDINSSRSSIDEPDTREAIAFACGGMHNDDVRDVYARDLAREIADLNNSLGGNSGDEVDEFESLDTTTDDFAMLSPEEFQRYVQVFEKLGSGASSCVYSATWHARRVALKCFTDDDDASNVQKEIEIMRAIDHPSIVKIYGACMSPLCLVLEIVHGGSLHEVLHCSSAGRSVALSEKSALKIANDIAEAMTYLHELKPNKIIHRDLKPQNVLIEKDTFRAILADFGVSRAVRTSLKTEKIGAGTVNYMAPCLFTDGKADEKVDVYAFAMILCETCTGKIPWKGKHPMAIASLVISGKRPSLPSNVREETKQLIEDCWADDSKDRPAFREILKRLEAQLSDRQ